MKRLTACTEIHKKGIPYVLVSRGKEGLIFSAGEKKIKAVAPCKDFPSITLIRVVITPYDFYAPESPAFEA